MRVPASTSNLGPGFDCLGVALRLYNYITLQRIRASEKGSRTTAMESRAARTFFRASGIAPIPFACTITGDVPRSRGLGSSVTVRLGILHGLNALFDRPLSRLEIYRLCVALEGHPDNAAPAEFGGFVVTQNDRPQKFPVSSRLHFVLLIPDFEVQTAAARRALPNELDRRAAVRSCGNACALVAAMASGRYRNLAGSFGDHLHQPFRAKFVPFLDRVIAAGEKAGALGGFLSGSGSTIICLTLRAPKKIARAMQVASGLTNARTLVTTADNWGTRLLAPESMAS